MHKKTWILLCLGTVLFCRSAIAFEGAEIKKLLSANGAKVSFSLRDPDGNEVLVSQGDRPLAPASVAKTISTACSLDQLGPQYQFDTMFGMTGKLHGDTLEGDLVVQGNGDPSFMIEDLHEVIEKLRHLHGIKKITGNLLFDNSYLAQNSLSIGSGFEGDEGRSFTAEITPTAINQNSFSFWIAPDIRDLSRVRAVSFPADVMDVKIIDKAKIGSSNDIGVSYDPSSLTATVHGTMTKDSEPKGIYRAADDSYKYQLRMIHKLWLESGGEWKNPEVKLSTSIVKATPLWRYQSRPLAKILMDVNKFSLNLGAEMIFLAAGADKYGVPANYEKSLKLLGECLQAKNVPLGSFVLTNASGLSREAMVKVSALSQFLYQYAKSPYGPEYLSSFGLLGLDGTSKSRLKSYAGRAGLKTGSLKNVRSIAGFLYAKDQKPYAFAMIQNSVNPNDAKKLEDEVIENFLKHN